MCYDVAAPALFARISTEFCRILNDPRSTFARDWLLLPAAMIIASVSAYASDGSDTDSARARPSTHRVQVVLEVRGDMKVKSDGGKVTTLPLLVEGGLTYDELLLDSKASPWSRRSVRHYSQAEAKMKVGNGALTRTLQPDHRLLVAQADRDGSLVFSPAGPLTRDELDLVDIQGNTLLLGCLLPDSAVKVGEEWKLNADQLAILLGLDVITQQDANCTWTGVENGIATMEVKGSIDGAVGGIPSKIALHARAQWDVAKRTITWFAAVIKEQRSIGQAEPGLDVVARLRMTISAVERSEHLSEAALAGVSLEARPGCELLAYQAERSHFRLFHDRRWRAVLDRHDVSILRLIDRGDLLAQCNISELPDQEPGKQMSLEEFQADIQRAIGQSFGQFLEATQNTRDDGRRVLRVVVSGTAS